MYLLPSDGDQFLTTNIYIAPALPSFTYIHTVFMWFSGTSTIYFIRPKYCALLVQSNTRKELFLRKRISALGSLDHARSMEDMRRCFGRQSVLKINIVKTTSFYYESVNSRGFETLLLGAILWLRDPRSHTCSKDVFRMSLRHLLDKDLGVLSEILYLTPT